jgi:hypothetical protein
MQDDEEYVLSAGCKDWPLPRLRSAARSWTGREGGLAVLLDAVCWSTEVGSSAEGATQP